MYQSQIAHLKQGAGERIGVLLIMLLKMDRALESPTTASLIYGLFFLKKSQEDGGTLIVEDRFVVMAGVERYEVHQNTWFPCVLMPFHSLRSNHYE